MKGTGLGVTCPWGWQIALLACVLNAGIISNYCNAPLRLKPARSFAPAPEAPTPRVAPGCSTQPQLRQHRSYPKCDPKHSGKTGENTGLGQTFPCKYQSS